MVSQEKIEQYKIWFNNLSFFDNSPFVLDVIEDLWDLINYIGKNYQIFCNCHIDKDVTYTRLNKEECLNLVQQFFLSNDISLNIDELIKNKTLVLKDNVDEDRDVFMRTKRNGSSYYDEYGNRSILVILENTIFDSMVLVHELMHYSNQPNDKRNFVSDLLTEAISYGIELIFCEELKDTNYCSDRSLFFKEFEKIIYNYVYQIFPIYKVILLYKKKSDINEELYKEMFDDENYELIMEQFEKYVQQCRSILRDTWYIIGFPLAIYILEEYKNDKTFFKSIKAFNDSINEQSLEECLSILGINNKMDFISKIKSSSDSFINVLSNLYNNKDMEINVKKNIVK